MKSTSNFVAYHPRGGATAPWLRPCEWRLHHRIKGLCFDKMACNMGTKGGVCILLEKEIGRELLNLACHRHHMLGIMLELFSIHDVSKSPKMDLFGHI
jgi:hypothetical protein